MYGILAIHEVCIQLDCVGMARMPYPPTKKEVCQNSLILKKSQSPDFHKPGLCYV